LVVVNGHGGNVDLLRTAAREVAKTTSLIVALINWWVDLAKQARRRVLETPEGHAAEDETSEVMAACLHLVREVPRDVDEWVEARYAAFGRETNQLLYQRAVQGYPQRPQERRGGHPQGCC
jgi:creatinine amidohydrolase